MKCNACKFKHKAPDEYPCNKCVHNSEDYFSLATNYEMIKAMSIGELATFICGIFDDGKGTKYIDGKAIPYFTPVELREWLGREVDD